MELHNKTGSNSALLEIKRRGLRWLGHVLRMPKESIPKVALNGRHPEEGNQDDHRQHGEREYWQSYQR